MNGYSRNGGYKNYSKGVAAGFEYEDSSEDEFMFGNDYIDEKPKQERQILDAKKAPEGNSQSQVSAPWLKGATKSPAVQGSRQNVQSNISFGSPKINLEDVSILGEDMRNAVTKGDEKFLRESLNSGFAVDTKIRSGWTALMYAAISGQPNIVKHLLSAGGNANFQKDMFTPLMALCTSTVKEEDKLIECAKCLLSSGARINAHDRHLVTPLMYAAQNGRPNLVKTLIENQSDVNYQDTRGWTPLAFAASSGHTHVVKVLLAENANENLCAYDGQSPADLAYASGYSTLADILENTSLRKGDESQNSTNDARPAKSSHSSKESRYYTYGDLELFLYGLELGHLVKVFRDHHLSFQDFLKITDEELTEIGIRELGVKKKILDAIRGVHANEWDLAGLSVDKNSKINTLEAAAIMANVTKHLKCIQSSVAYLQNYVTNNKDNICKDDPSLQKILVDQCRDGLKVSGQLKNSVYSLRSYVTKTFPRANETPCDMIQDRKKSRRKKILILLGAVSVLGLVTTMGHKIVEKFSQR